MHSNSLITELGIMIACAAVITLVVQRFKLPIFLSYILTGILLNPAVFPYSPIHDLGTVKALSQLGVIFLMFYIGMEFDVRRLRSVFAPVLLAVVIQTTLLIFLGIQTAPILGWTTIDGFFLGALLAISSTMVTVTVLKNLNLLNHSHAKLAIGVLILEDILAVLLLVLLSGVAVTGYFKWENAGWVTFLIGVFVIPIYLLGKVVAPPLLKRINRIGSTELLTLFSVGLVLIVSVLAAKFNFSVALGAFLAGSILSQSSLCKEIERATEPLRNLFCAVFFISVGLLIKPQLIIDRWEAALLLAGLVIVFKVVSCWLGFALAGQDAKTGFKAALAKSQIGEFGIIIAGLGETLGVTHSGLMSLAVSIALLTIMATPLLASHSDRIYNFFAQRTPETFKTLGRFYGNFLDMMRERLGTIVVLRLIKRPVLQTFAYFFLLNGIILLSSVIARYIERQAIFESYTTWLQSAIWFLAALFCLPFLIAVIRNMNVIVMVVTEATLGTPATQQFLQGRMKNIFSTVILCLILILIAGIFLSAAASYLPSGVALVVFLILGIGAGFIFWRQMVYLNSRLEYLFMQSFNLNIASHDPEQNEGTLNAICRKYPWSVSVVEITVREGSIASGRRILDLNIRQETGVSIVAIARGKQIYYDPSPETPLFEGDRIFILGDKNQIDQARRLLSTQTSEPTEQASHTTFEIEKVYLERESPFVGETLAGSQLRSQHRINVLGIQRGEIRITSPSPDEILKPGDVLYVIGNREAIRKFQGYKKD